MTSAEAAARENRDRWGALADDLRDLYPIATSPSEGTTDLMLALFDRVDATCSGYRTWMPMASAGATVGDDDNGGANGQAGDSPQPELTALTTDDLLLTHASKDQLDYINGRPFDGDSMNEQKVVLPGDDGWGPLREGEWKITPQRCADMLIFNGTATESVWETLNPTGEASETQLRDMVNGAEGDLVLWLSGAWLSTAEAASDVFDMVDRGLADCAGTKYSSGGSTSELETDVMRSGRALVRQGQDSVWIFEPIGAVLYFASAVAEPSGLTRGLEVYNAIADNIAAAQGTKREPVLLDGPASKDAAAVQQDADTPEEKFVDALRSFGDAVIGSEPAENWVSAGETVCDGLDDGVPAGLLATVGTKLQGQAVVWASGTYLCPEHALDVAELRPALVR
ncbi:MAG: DUF732 domain-containing protein [Actinomycetales bacterium]|nr:DUF732 domain-containing protein [Actinomycetales bacterium]